MISFYINGDETSVQLENEKTIGDVLHSFELTCEENNAAVIGISIDDKIITAELFDGKKSLAKETADARAKSKITFSNLNVTEWNAEEPYNYDLFITFQDANGNKTYVKNVTGFKTVEIKGNVFYFNSTFSTYYKRTT